MFDTMDKDGSGLIDFKELLTGLSTALRGNPQQRLDFYFGLYDMDGIYGKMKILQNRNEGSSK